MMKRISYFVLMCLGITALAGCDKECDCAGTGEFEYMVFGHFYGECGGEGCVEIYKLSEVALYEDSTDVYPGNLAPYAGVYTLLSDEKFQQVKDLIYQLPEELYAESNRVQGMPDAADWGGIYVEMKYKDEPGLSGFWLLDQNENNMPQVYNDFVDKINAKIALINQ